jgi:hypothetical protein
MARECIAVRVRLINRVITALYDEALRPFVLRISQANILSAISYRLQGHAPRGMIRTAQQQEAARKCIVAARTCIARL